MKEALLIVIAYMIGSIPTAVWVSKAFFGIDIRDYGSGNAGATNTFRVLGSRWGTFVMLIDMLKGVAATSLYILLPYCILYWLNLISPNPVMSNSEQYTVQHLRVLF